MYTSDKIKRNHENLTGICDFNKIISVKGCWVNIPKKSWKRALTLSQARFLHLQGHQRSWGCRQYVHPKLFQFPYFCISASPPIRRRPLANADESNVYEFIICGNGVSPYWGYMHSTYCQLYPRAPSSHHLYIHAKFHLQIRCTSRDNYCLTKNVTK